MQNTKHNIRINGNKSQSSKQRNMSPTQELKFSILNLNTNSLMSKSPFSRSINPTIFYMSHMAQHYNQHHIAHEF